MMKNRNRTMRKNWLSTLGFIVLALLVALPATTEAAKKPKQGWTPKLTLGLNLSLAQTANVPGIDDGITMNIGALINGSLLYRKRVHEWKTDLDAVHTQTKTPAIDPFVKTADKLDLKSYYTFRPKHKYGLGLFLGAELSTSIFPNKLVVGEKSRLEINSLDKTEPTKKTLEKNDEHRLTDSFNPLLLKQKLGFEIQPYKDKFTKLSLKIGYAAQEVFASGHTVGGKADLAPNPNEVNPAKVIYTLTPLQDYIQTGVDLSVSLTGSLQKRISFALTANFMLPITTNIDTKGLTGFELLNADINFKVGVKLAKWASLDYLFRAIRAPLLIDKWQVSSNLALTIKADFI